MNLLVRRTGIISALLVVAIVLSLTPLSWAVDEGGKKTDIETVVVIHCDYPPVSFWDRNTGSPAGFVVDIMNRVAARGRLQVTYICKNSWDDMLDAIESGEADIGALMKSEKREKRVLFTSPIEVSYLSYFARSQSSLDPDRIPEGYNVGVVKGSMSFERLRKRPKVSLLTYGSYQDGLFGLLSGEIGLFAGEESMIQKRARETHLEDRFKKVGQPFAELERGFVVSKNNVQLHQLLDKVLSGFKGSPEYQRIYLKWYGTPTPYWTNTRILTASGVFLFIAVCGMALWRYISVSKINEDLIRNISERKHAEEQIGASLREKEVLLKEVHHRVKNNLNVVASLLNLQSRYIAEPAVINIFQECRNRINSMALIHEKLYQTKDFSNIKFQEYLNSLISMLASSYIHMTDKVSVVTNIKDVALDIDTAIACGLITNELLTNSLKYAFPESQEGIINISLSGEGGKYVLAVSDNGVGLPAGFDLNATKTLGLQMVKMLAKQLNGTMEIIADKGTDIRISFQ